MDMRDSGKYKNLAERKWTDGEPDTLTVAVRTDRNDGQASITFTCTDTWLTADVVQMEVIPWLEECIKTADAANGRPVNDQSDPCDGHRVDWHATLWVDGVDINIEEDDDFDLLCKADLLNAIWGAVNGRTMVTAFIHVHEDLPMGMQKNLLEAEVESVKLKIKAVFPDAAFERDHSMDHLHDIRDANGDLVPNVVGDETVKAFYAGRLPAPECPHYIAASEVRAGFLTCENC